MRLCTQHQEWKVYNSIAQRSPVHRDDSAADPNLKHVIFYEGTEIIGAAQMHLSFPNAFLAFFELNDTLIENRSERVSSLKLYFIRNIEKWARQLSILNLHICAGFEDEAFFRNCGYSETTTSTGDRIHLYKVLSSSVWNSVEDEVGASKAIYSMGGGTVPRQLLK